mmetsp:Transcript_18089/g.43295  ORF Transcript_18089/g.43295 Transcript_18089/m.43295 type:complete len:312 (+) Transcript_18089:701-1636(+)
MAACHGARALEATLQPRERREGAQQASLLEARPEAAPLRAAARPPHPHEICQGSLMRPRPPMPARLGGARRALPYRPFRREARGRAAVADPTPRGGCRGDRAPAQLPREKRTNRGAWGRTIPRGSGTPPRRGRFQSLPSTTTTLRTGVMRCTGRQKQQTPHGPRGPAETPGGGGPPTRRRRMWGPPRTEPPRGGPSRAPTSRRGRQRHAAGAPLPFALLPSPVPLPPPQGPLRRCLLCPCPHPAPPVREPRSPRAAVPRAPRPDPASLAARAPPPSEGPGPPEARCSLAPPRRAASRWPGGSSCTCSAPLL